LSKSQNRRIVSHLGRRLRALDLDRLPDEALNAFHDGIAVHNPRHFRYLTILSTSAIAKNNAAMNRVMPSAAHLILRRAI
jgi:hypothetical protein